MKKIVFSIIILIIVVVLSIVFGTTVFAETYGDLTYSVAYGEVTITGCKTTATEVEIPSEIDGHPVTKIDSYAFANSSILSTITIPSSITSIREQAFVGCDSLMVVNIESIDSWLKIDFEEAYLFTNIMDHWYYSYYSNPLLNGASLYLNNKLLEVVEIPDGIKKINTYAFSNCTQLKEVIFNDDIETIGGDAFLGCTNLNKISIKNIESWLKIEFLSSGDHVFEPLSWYSNPLLTGADLYMNGELLDTIEIPDNVKQINSFAFCDYKGLKTVVFGNNIEMIGENAFDGCTGLSAVYINSIDSWCKIKFSNSLSNPVTYAKKLFLNNELLTNLILPSSVVSINDYAFYNCSEIINLTISESVKSIGSYAFKGCNGVENISIPDTFSDIDNSIFGDTAYYKNADNWKNDVLYIGNYLVEAKLTIKGCYSVIPGTIAICSSAFSGCSELSGIIIPDSVKNINDSAFYGCSKLASITIPDTVTNFANCMIEDTAYYNNDNNWQDGFLYIDNHLIGVKQTIKGPYSIKSETVSIYSYAFSGCKKLTSITIPASVKSISDSAFSGCDGLLSVYISSLDSWCKIDFGNMYANPLYYAENFYLNNELLSDVIIPDSVISIAAYSFANYQNLNKITIPDSVKTIGDSAFYKCSGLVAVNVQSIGAWCEIDFQNWDSNPIVYAKKLYLNNDLITDLVIPPSVTSLKKVLFYNCSDITTITIPDSLTSIEENVFNGCNNLAKVYINNMESWCNIDFQHPKANPLYYAKKLYLNNELVTDLKIPLSVNSITDYAFYNCSSLKKIEIPDTVAMIGTSAFYNCSNLEKIVMPEMVTSIGDYAFYNCASLENVIIPDSITAISVYTFGNCVGLKSIELPQSIKSIGSSAFYNCTGLADVYITSIEEWCKIDFAENFSNPLYYAKNFYLNNELIKNLVFPDSVTKIADYAFYGFSGIKNVTISASVEQIGDEAFSGCIGIDSFIVDVRNGKYSSDENGVLFDKDGYVLIQYPVGNLRTEYTVPNSVKMIDSFSFAKCNGLKKILIGDGVEKIGYAAFEECLSLEYIKIPFVGESETAKNECSVLGYIFGYTCKYSWYDFIPDGIHQYTDYETEYYYHIPESLKTIEFSDVSEIYGFSNCYMLTSIVIPDSVKSIDTYSFNNTNLRDIYYMGSMHQWKEIYMDNPNKINNIYIHYDCDKKEHAEFVLPAKDATCTETGLTEGLGCSGCDIVYLTQSVLPEKGHDYVETKKHPTCIDKGFTAYTCACGDSYILDEADALGHDWTAFDKCLRCGEVNENVVEYNAKITFSKVRCRPGDTIEVYVSLDLLTNVKSMAIYDITYNTDKLTLINGEWLVESAVISDWNQNDEAGVITFIENEKLDGAILRLTFKITEGIEDSEETITCNSVIKTEIADDNEITLNVNVVSGCINIVNIIRGDVNGDNVVSSDDAVYLLYHTLIPGRYKINQDGDFNGNGKVNSNDAIYLLYHVLIPDRYPL